MRRTCPTRTARSEESGQLADPDPEVEPFVHQGDDPVEQQQANVDLRIFAEKGPHDR